MDLFKQTLDFLSLPDEIAIPISDVIRPYNFYFSTILQIKFEETSKLNSEKTRLQAFHDLINEASITNSRYKEDYNYHLEELGEYHLSSNFFASPGYELAGGRTSGTKTNDLNDIPLSIEYNEFAKSEEIFNLKIDEIMAANMRLSIKLTIEEKYNIKKKVERGEILPVDLKSEFLNIFKSQETGLEFIELLKGSKYISKGDEWYGLSKELGELRDAYYSLKEKKWLKPTKSLTNNIRIFYNRFGLITKEQGGDYISERSFRTFNFTKDFYVFVELIKGLSQL